ncbi:MAG: DUF362 domain-containing protein [Deltaproteobacteria bacterium]|nr:DUF362 domain-containing protein [Deltaproteobacteria bacterium]
MENAKSRVYFADLRAGVKRNLFDKLDVLMERVDLKRKFSKGQLIAIKLHFGEKGNTSYIRPNFVRRVVERVKETGAKPFLTDANTLYVGQRGESVSHLITAIENGFDYAVAGAPLIIADGLRGESARKIQIEGQHFKEVSIGSEIVAADGMVVLTHFKCHEMTGFGGAIKNIGMGCASREGKLAQHSNVAPIVDQSGCTGCESCYKWCPAGAITVEGRKALIDANICIGCGKCIIVCPEKTIHIQWDETTAGLQEKMAEYACGGLKGKDRRVVFINFITQVTPSCDCYGHTDAPIVPDIGILASDDPVALDHACAVLVNQQEGIKNTALESGHEPGGDKFRGVHPEVDWEIQLVHAEKMGLGNRGYELIAVL